ncbi:MAG: nucleoside transporter rane protein [Blastococcus sp.]|jgi:ABC-type uncharacterized transport system permease subunit|nr:nucleoside transporter rane protein [Blastococcus sp.]
MIPFPWSGTRRLLAALVVPVAALVATVLTVSVVIAASGADPVAAFTAMFQGAFGNPTAIGTTVTKALPRLLPALGILIALRAGLWNIGAEGQIYIGALAAAAVALFTPTLPWQGTMLLALAAAALAAGVWCLIPGVLRTSRGVNEVITTLMLVYVGIQLTNYVIEHHWADPQASFPATPVFPQEARLPVIVPGTLVNAGVLVAIAAVALTWWIVTRTPLGLALRALGGSVGAAKVAGVNTTRAILIAMMLSGAFAGLGGAVEVLGTRGRLLEGFSVGYGFEAIAVALLGRLHPVGVVAAALLFGALDAGGSGLQAAGGSVSAGIVPLTAGCAMVYVLAALGVVSIRQRRRSVAVQLRAAGPPREDPATAAAAVIR